MVSQKRILCLNKVDFIKNKRTLLPLAKQFEDLYGYDRFVRSQFHSSFFWFSWTHILPLSSLYLQRNLWVIWTVVGKLGSYIFFDLDLCRIFMISGLTGSGVKDVTDYLVNQVRSMSCIPVTPTTCRNFAFTQQLLKWPSLRDAGTTFWTQLYLMGKWLMIDTGHPRNGRYVQVESVCGTLNGNIRLSIGKRNMTGNEWSSESECALISKLGMD